MIKQGVWRELIEIKLKLTKSKALLVSLKEESNLSMGATKEGDIKVAKETMFDSFAPKPSILLIISYFSAE